MSNFDFLKNDPQFESFADVAIVAEKLYHLDLATCVINCRRAMEFAVKWMYSVDKYLEMPYQDTLVSLLNTDDFRDIVGKDLYRYLDYIRRVGNNATHTSSQITTDQVALALEYLYAFMDFISYCYSNSYVKTSFDIKRAAQEVETPIPVSDEIDLEQLSQENKHLQPELTARRISQEKSYSPKPLDLTEAQTRKAYIDVMLTSVGWTRGTDWLDEYEIEEMPNKSGIGFADYVLLGDNGKPLAVIEAKKTSVDVATGRQQAKLYADDLERRFGRRPIIFLTNGFDTRIWIDQEKGYPERSISGIYSKRDLEKEFNKMTQKSHLSNIVINDKISNRYYQKDAIQSVCNTFDERNRRKALLVMATGSGKTRTVISLVDILIRHGWVKNFLFLADRKMLVKQAKDFFYSHLPDVSTTNLVGKEDNINARGVFSTYQTLIHKIDDTTDETGGKLYTPGHFDLIIVDEAHRSIYNKYKDIFTYFDAHLIGLTATPRDEIDKNTYDIFDLETGVPTYGYELAQAVEDKFLADYSSIETQLKFMTDGIVFDELSDAEKEEYEECFANEDGKIPEKIESSALNSWVYNDDTIKQVLNLVMTQGLKVEYGNKIGKTIIFAKKHTHAEKILKVWNAEYPHYPSGFCTVIDNYTNYAESLIASFSNPKQMPQIAISVDMLDTGIDIPEILNLVFFKKVMSKAKFWQMIGRGTRLCEGLHDGTDKEKFYIFDFCSNFEFFRINEKGIEGHSVASLPEQLFNLKISLIYELQDLSLQTDELIALRKSLVDDLVEKVSALNRDNFAVRLHIQHIDHFQLKESYQRLSYENTRELAEHVAPLIEPEQDEYTATRFDALMYRIELAHLLHKNDTRAKKDLCKKLDALTKYGTIPEVREQKEFIEILLHPEYLNQAGISDFEKIRIELRNLMKYIEQDPITSYSTNFIDTIVEVREHEANYGSSDLENYRKKANYYIRQNQDNPVIAKLKTNRPLFQSDIHALEQILWSKLGTKQEYQEEYGDMPLGEFVRSIVGVDMNTAKKAFAQFLGDVSLDQRQIYFVDQIINYIVKNGMLKDFALLQKSPFTDKGSIADIFTDLNVWTKIRHTIETFNSNIKVA